MSTVGRGKSIHAPTKRTVFSWLTSRACLISHNNVDVISTWKYLHNVDNDKHLIFNVLRPQCLHRIQHSGLFYVPFSWQFSWWQRVRLCKCRWLWTHVLVATMYNWQLMPVPNSYQIVEVRNSMPHRRWQQKNKKHFDKNAWIRMHRRSLS